jgi:KipI family sensor histidine kinase inhibitor
MRYNVAAVDALILTFGETIDPATSQAVLSLYRRLTSTPLPGLIEIIPSYTTLYLQFDLHRYTHETLFELLQTMSQEGNNETLAEGKTITIPVYYGSEVGWDLERIAQMHELSIEKVIMIHTEKSYRVYTIGFMPGFSYMGEADARIATPRLATPRTHVPAGAVAVANTQCAVYPLESPGGWNILGRTPLKLFDPQMEGFSLLHPGDEVRFEAIGREAYLELGGAL